MGIGPGPHAGTPSDVYGHCHGLNITMELMDAEVDPCRVCGASNKLVTICDSTEDNERGYVCRFLEPGLARPFFRHRTDCTVFK
jgi:hypothetical protein